MAAKSLILGSYPVWVIRYTRLKFLPPAVSFTSLLAAGGVGCAVIEYGLANANERQLDAAGKLFVGLGPGWVRWLPRRLRAGAQLISLFFQLVGLALIERRPRLLLAEGLQEQFLCRLLSSVLRVPYCVHVHEIADHGNLRGLNRLLARAEGWALRGARFLIFPAESRLRLAQELYGVSNPVFIVFNAPLLRTPTQPHSLADRLGVTPALESQFVVYLGGIGDLNAIAEAAAALQYLPDSVHLVLVGWVEEEYRARINRVVETCGTNHRLHWVAPTDKKWEWVDCADVGLCLYKPVEPRAATNATASNKIMEFISAGVPSVVGTSPDFREFIEQFPVGVMSDSSDPRAIAKAIETALRQSSQQWREQIQKLHRESLHYEKLAGPAIDAVKSAVGSSHKPNKWIDS